MKTQTQLCMIWCSEPHSLLAKASSSSPSCEHRGHYCVRNIIIFMLLSPSHHHRHHHHHRHTIIIKSPSTPSSLTSPPSCHHPHHHLHPFITKTIVTITGHPSPLSDHHQHHDLHPFITSIIIVTTRWHHDHYRIINTITFIPSSPRSPSSLSQDSITIIVSSAPSHSSCHQQHHYYHHHHLTSSPLCVITTITFILLSPSPSPPPSAPPPLSTRFWIPMASRQSLFNWPERTVFLFSSSQKDSHLTDVFLRAVEHPWWPENKEKWWSHVLVRQPLSGLKTNWSGLSLLHDFCAVSPPYPHLSCVTVLFLRNQLREIEDNKVSFCPLRSLQQILVSLWRNWLSWISRGREMFISVMLLFWEKWQAWAISDVSTLKVKHSCGPMHWFLNSSFRSRASLVAQLVKNPPAIQETQVWFLDQEDPLEKG